MHITTNGEELAANDTVTTSEPHPDSVTIVLANFNHCNLTDEIPNYMQQVTNEEIMYLIIAILPLLQLTGHIRMLRWESQIMQCFVLSRSTVRKKTL